MEVMCRLPSSMINFGVCQGKGTELSFGVVFLGNHQYTLHPHRFVMMYVYFIESFPKWEMMF